MRKHFRSLREHPLAHNGHGHLIVVLNLGFVFEQQFCYVATGRKHERRLSVLRIK